MNYGTKNKKGEWEVLRLYDFLSYENNIYRRNAVLETDENVKYQLADITLPDGILRVDKVNVSEATDICLGHYTLAQIKEGKTEEAFSSRTIKVGKTNVTCYSNGEYELALIPLYGWSQDAKALYPRGLHPVSKTCLLPILNEKVESQTVLVTLQLWKKIDKNGNGFTAKELAPVKAVNVSKDSKTIIVKLSNGTKTINFK